MNVRVNDMQGLNYLSSLLIHSIAVNTANFAKAKNYFSKLFSKNYNFNFSKVNIFKKFEK